MAGTLDAKGGHSHLPGLPLSLSLPPLPHMPRSHVVTRTAARGPLSLGSWALWDSGTALKALQAQEQPWKEAL